MAQRRMFSLKVVDTDSFLEMSQTAQNLYFHLGMRADDDGFVANPKKILKFLGANEDDLRLLSVKQFIIPFQSGVIVIRHWRENNYIQSDRKHGTIYEDELASLSLNNSGHYQLSSGCIHVGYNMDTEVRLGKDRLGKDREEEADKPLRQRFQKPDLQSVKEYMKEIECPEIEAQRLIDYYDSNGWMVGRNKMKDWKAACRNWKSNVSKFGQRKSGFKPHGIGFDPSDPEQKAAHDRLMAKWGDK